MNGEYIITPGNVYYDKREKEKFKIDEQSIVKYGQVGYTLEKFDEFVFTPNFPNTINDFFSKLGTKITEKGNFMLFEHKQKDGSMEHIYIYNSLEAIPQYKHGFYYAQILFEDQEELLKRKTEDFCSFVFVNNISKISRIVKLETIRNQEEFIQSMGNSQFIQSDLTQVDDKLLEDLFLLGKGAYIGRWGKVFMYGFLESGGRLVPIIFDGEDSSDYSLDLETSYDKVDVIYHLQGRNKVSLLGDKIEEQVCVFPEDVSSREDLQDFYNQLFAHNGANNV